MGEKEQEFMFFAGPLLSLYELVALSRGEGLPGRERPDSPRTKRADVPPASSESNPPAEEDEAPVEESG